MFSFSKVNLCHKNCGISLFDITVICFIEFSSVRTWIEQLIVKQTSIQQLQKKGECAPPAPPAPPASAVSNVKNIFFTPKLSYTESQPQFQASRSSSPAPGLTESDIQINDTQKPQKYASDLYNNPFPITQDIIDQIPASAKKSESRFVTSLLRLMYTDNYLGTHTMAANLSGKKNMDDNALVSIISKYILVSMQYFITNR